MARDWMADANCTDLPVDVFFPVPGRHMKVNIIHAKAYCRACPVQTACLEFALQFDHRTLPGIWGGTTENERLKIRRTRLLQTRQ